MILLLLLACADDKPAACTSTWYADADHDTFGDPAVTLSACDEPWGYVAQGGDCDDTDVLIYPGRPELLGNCVDDDCDGAPESGCAPSGTTRISVASDGTEADRERIDVGYGSDRGSFSAAISADGRYVAFGSVASNLATGAAAEGMNIFRHDTVTGETIWVDTPVSGEPQPGGAYRVKGEPVVALSGDGGRAAFWSSASVDGGVHGNGVYFRDLPAGTSTPLPSATQADGTSPGWLPTISADATGIGVVVPYDSASDIGEACTSIGYLVARPDSATAAVAVRCDSAVRAAALSADGTTACLVVVAADTTSSVQVWDLAADSRTVISTPMDARAWECALSADGGVIVLTAEAELVVDEDDDGGVTDIYAWTLATGELELVSLPATDVTDATVQHAYGPSISGDGRYVTFVSAGAYTADKLGTNKDVYVRDRVDGTTRRVSVSATGGNADSDSDQAVISQDGAWIAFTSEASDLVANDTNRCEDVFRSPRP